MGHDKVSIVSTAEQLQEVDITGTVGISTEIRPAWYKLDIPRISILVLATEAHIYIVDIMNFDKLDFLS